MHVCGERMGEFVIQRDCGPSIQRGMRPYLEGTEAPGGLRGENKKMNASESNHGKRIMVRKEKKNVMDCFL